MIILLSVLFLSACSEEEAAQAPAPTPREPTAEERVVLQVLSQIEVAVGYNTHCVDDGEALPENLMGNMQQTALQTAELFSLHVPEGTPDEEAIAYVEGRMNKFAADVRPRIEQIFKEDGCESEKGLEAKKFHSMYSELTPAQLYGLVLQEIGNAKAAEEAGDGEASEADAGAETGAGE